MSVPNLTPNPQPASGNEYAQPWTSWCLFFPCSLLISANCSHCSAGSQNTAAPAPVACTYNLDRFMAQNVRDDGAFYGRLPSAAYTPPPDSLASFYEARAVGIISSFVAAFGTGSPDN